MEKTIGILGGDLRSIELSEIFSEKGINVKTYALFEENADIFENFIEKSDFIVAGTPFSRDGENVNTLEGKEKIAIDKLFSTMSSSKVLFAGSISDSVKKKAEGYEIKVYDLLNYEDIAVLNAIPSAEGAIEVALKSMKTTLHSSNCFILGYGRIGKILANILKGFGANVFVVARKDSDFAWIKAMGYVPLKYDKLEKSLFGADVIFNTVPHLVLDTLELEHIDKNCVIIDLASKPGGVNFEKAKELGLETYWALGLPGKVAPRSAARYMADKIISLTQIDNKLIM